MPFSQEDTDRIRADLKSALASSKLTQWQRTFIGDMQVRFDKYGPRTRLSDKQYAKLKQVLAPFEAETPRPRRRASTLRSKPAPVTSRPPRRSKPRSPLRTIRKARRSMREAIWIVAAIGGLFVAVIGGFDSSTGPHSDRVTSSLGNGGPLIYSAKDFNITDGDTVQLYGARKGTRLVGFNTPETYKPQCNRELALGKQATARLADLVRSSDRVELRLVACACPSGTQGTNACNYGRSCGMLTVNGRDVGDILVKEGLAARFRCGRTSCPPLPRPWCR